MEALYLSVCSQLITQLSRKQALDYEHPTDIDRHDDDVEIVKKRIDMLRKMRDEMESVL